MRTTADPSLITLPPRLDVATSAGVRRLLHEAVDHCIGDLRLDVSQVDVIDAAGLGVLVGARRRADLIGVRVILVDVPPRLQRLLAVTRLSRLFTYENVITIPEQRVSVS
jgi:anti-sigma B factor antagonist